MNKELKTDSIFDFQAFELLEPNVINDAVSRNGYAVIKNFYPRELCDRDS